MSNNCCALWAGRSAGGPRPAGGLSDSFGDSVAISRSTAVVGAEGNSGTGAAYVFVSV
jgi:hypothetical protein